MTLQDLIRKITEAENALSNQLDKGDYDLANDYVQRAQDFLKRLVEMKDSLSDEELKEAQEFAQSYAEHIKEQVKELAVRQAKLSDDYRNVKFRHKIANKYTQVRKSR